MKRKIYNKFKPFFDYLLEGEIPIVSDFMRSKIYDKAFFEHANKLKILSSKKVSKIISSYYEFKTVFDIGCGMGLYIDELKRLGKDVLGCDVSKAAIKMGSEVLTIFQADVTKPIKLDQKFDLVICFEVAEHINNRYSKQLVKNCTDFSDTVLFTAAPIGQGGVGHINEQPYEFWINIFKEFNFKYERDLSERIREEMQRENVVYWIANNFMGFSII